MNSESIPPREDVEVGRTICLHRELHWRALGSREDEARTGRWAQGAPEQTKRDSTKS